MFNITLYGFLLSGSEIFDIFFDDRVMLCNMVVLFRAYPKNTANVYEDIALK